MSTDLPAIGFALGTTAALFLVLRFNLRTHVLVKKIQDAYAVEGRIWLFWSDPSQLFRFLLRPNNLLDSGDSARVQAAKEALLKHRNTLRINLLLAWGSMLLPIVLAVSILVLLAMRSG